MSEKTLKERTAEAKARQAEKEDELLEQKIRDSLLGFEIDVSKRDAIRKSLTSNLAKIGKDKAHWLDMVNDYMQYWAYKEEMLFQINSHGAMILYKVKGNMATKPNPAIKEAMAISKQLDKILESLSLDKEFKPVIKLPPRAVGRPKLIKDITTEQIKPVVKESESTYDDI